MLRKIILPVSLTYLISWFFIGIYFFLLGGKTTSIYFPFFGVFIMWIPGLIGLYFSRKEGISIPLFKRPDKSFLFAGLSAIGICAAATLLSIPFGHIDILSISLSAFIMMLPAAFIFGMTINMLAAMGEEIFWRGYLYEKLKGMGPLKTMLIIGLIWGLWHAPLILMGYNYPQNPILGAFLMILLCVAMTPILQFFRIRGKAIMIPAAFHGTINASAGISQLVFIKPDPLILGLTGIIGIIIFAFISSWLLQNLTVNDAEKE